MIRGLYRSFSKEAGNEYDILVYVKETMNTYDLELRRLEGKNIPIQLEFLFDGVTTVKIRKDKKLHQVIVWDNEHFTLYPFRAGVPFCFEKLRVPTIY